MGKLLGPFRHHPKAKEIVKPNPATLKARLRSNEEINELRIKRNKLQNEKRKYKSPEIRRELTQEIKKVRKLLSKKTKTMAIKYKEEKLREIEGMKKKECKRMWFELKKLAGWDTIEDTPQVLLNEKGEEVDGTLEIWRKAFEKLARRPK